jgi:Na+/H+-dicarboxylate symporter
MSLFYLVLVLAAFGSFGIALAVARLQYTAWLKKQSLRPSQVAMYTASSKASKREMARAS